MEIKNFFKTALLSFNPGSYGELSQRILKDAFKYFLGVLLAGFIIMCLLFTPKLFMMPQDIYDGLGAFKTLDINLEKDMQKPIVLTGNRPFITIDITGKNSTLQSGRILVTENYIEYNFIPFTGPTRVDTSDSSDIMKNRRGSAILATTILILLLPAILFYYFILLAIKYLIVILIGALLCLFLARMIRLELTFSEILKIALYASTIMIAVELLTKPFVPSIYYIQYGLFAIYLIAGSIKAGEFVPRKRKKY